MRGFNKILWLSLAKLLFMSQPATSELICPVGRVNQWKEKCPSLMANNVEYVTEWGKTEVEEEAKVIFTGINNPDVQKKIQEAREAAKQLTGKAIEVMNDMRGYATAWYEISLQNIRAYMCENFLKEEDASRCVPPGDDNAAVNVDNECIRLLDEDSCHARGLCERAGNCKWVHPVQNATSREYWYSASEYEVSKDWVENEYPKSFAPFAVPGILLACLSMISWFLFCFLRCCCNRCWGRDPHRDGYTRCQILFPSIVFLVFTLGIVICAGTSYVQNEQITDGAHGVFDSAEMTLSNLNILTRNVLQPLQNVQRSVNATVAEIDQELVDTAWLHSDFTELQAMMAEFSRLYTTLGPYPFEDDCDPSTTEWCIACPHAVCTAAQTQVVVAQERMEAAKEVLAGVVDAMKENLASNKDLIYSSLSMAENLMGKVFNLTRDSQEQIDDVRQRFDDLKLIRMGGVLAMFAIGLVIAVVGILGVLCGLCSRKSSFIHLLHLSWILGLVVCILGLIFSSALITVAVLWNDGCHYMNAVRKDVSPYFPHQMVKVTTACFNDTNLLYALEMEERMSFTCVLDQYFEETGSLNVNENFQLLYDYGDSIKAYDKSDFGYSDFRMNTLLSNTATAIASTSPSPLKPTTTESLGTPWTLYGKDSDDSTCTSTKTDKEQVPLCYMELKCRSDSSNCFSVYRAAYLYHLSYRKIDQALFNMNTDFNSAAAVRPGWTYPKSIRKAAQDYGARLTALKSNVMTKLKSGLVGAITDKVDHMKCSMTCGWINYSYEMLHINLCETLLGASLSISLCIFLMSLFLIPIVICGIILQKRLRGVRKGSKEARATKM